MPTCLGQTGILERIGSSFRHGSGGGRDGLRAYHTVQPKLPRHGDCVQYVLIVADLQNRTFVSHKHFRNRPEAYNEQL